MTGPAKQSQQRQESKLCNLIEVGMLNDWPCETVLAMARVFVQYKAPEDSYSGHGCLTGPVNGALQIMGSHAP